MPRKREDVTPGEACAQELKALLEMKGWSQQQLADRLAEIGAPMDRTTIAKIQSGARKVSLDDAFALAVALDVSLIRLVTPELAGWPTALAPKVVVTAGSARSWIRGHQAVPDRHEPTYYEHVPEEDAIAQRLAGLDALYAVLTDFLDASFDAERGVVDLDSDDAQKMLRYVGQELRRARADIEHFNRQRKGKR